MKDPRLLPCHHIVCLTCLQEDWKPNALECRACRYVSQAESDFVASVLNLCFGKSIIGQSAKMFLEAALARKMIGFIVISELTSCFKNQ